MKTIEPQIATAQYRVGCDLRYNVGGPSGFLFNVGVISNKFQKVLEESFYTEPGLQVEEVKCENAEKRHHRFSANAGELRVIYSAIVELSHHEQASADVPEVPPSQLPAEVMPFLYPSRYCESDKLVRFAQDEFGKLPPGFSRVTGICNWIYEHVDYLRGSTNPLTSAFDTVTERAGVCRDFAHMAIACCRALAIPARFTAGYALALDPPDFHAYFEAYLGGHWYIFDATRLSPQSSFIRVGTGRDAADTSFATIFGPVTFQSMAVTMEHIGGDQPEFTISPISTC